MAPRSTRRRTGLGGEPDTRRSGSRPGRDRDLWIGGVSSRSSSASAWTRVLPHPRQLAEHVEHGHGGAAPGHRRDLRHLHRRHRPVRRRRTRLQRNGRGVGHGAGFAGPHGAAPLAVTVGFSRRCCRRRLRLVDGVLVAWAEIPPSSSRWGRSASPPASATCSTTARKSPPSRRRDDIRRHQHRWLAACPRGDRRSHHHRFGFLLAKTRFGAYTLSAGTAGGGRQGRHQRPPHLSRST